METQNPNTPQSPADSKKTLPSDPESCERIIQEAAAKALALAKSREIAQLISPAASIVVGQDDFAKRAELSRRVRAGELVKVGRLEYREATPTERLDFESRKVAMDLEAKAYESQKIEGICDAAAQSARRRSEALFSDSACPTRHVIDLDAVDSNPRWIATRDLLLAQALRGRGFLVALLGPSGTGKTQLAVSVVHRVCDNRVSARYIKALELFRDFRTAYTAVGKGDAGISEEAIAEKWISYGLLVVDEAHLRAGTEFEQRTMVNMLDRRYDEMRATILIANQGKQEFAEQVGPSITSRIHQTGEAIVCDWPSYRKPGSWRADA